MEENNKKIIMQLRWFKGRNKEIWLERKANVIVKKGLTKKSQRRWAPHVWERPADKL